MKELICFDLDNTLLNSEKAHVASYNYALEKYGFKKWKFYDMAKLFGRPHDEIIKILTGENDRKLIRNIDKVKKSFLINNAYRLARVLPGVKFVLKSLKKDYDLAILSNAAHKSIIVLLKGANLDKSYFTIIIGNDDVKHSKPKPDEIIKAEKLTHHKAEFMVGDSIYDIMAGKRAKVKTVGILSGRYTRKELGRYKPNFIIKDIKGLLRIV